MMKMDVHHLNGRGGTIQDIKDAVGMRRLFSVKEWRRVPFVSKVFLAFVFLQTVAYIIIRTFKFKLYASCADLSLTDQTWVLIVAVFLNVSVIYFAINGVIRQKITELYSFLLASLLQVWAANMIVLQLNAKPLQFVRAIFDWQNDGTSAVVIADMALCGIAFVTYLPLCFFVARAFGWTTFGAYRCSWILNASLTVLLQRLLAEMISNDGFFTGFSRL